MRVGKGDACAGLYIFLVLGNHLRQLKYNPGKKINYFATGKKNVAYMLIDYRAVARPYSDRYIGEQWLYQSM